jgi:hypothetical protein
VLAISDDAPVYHHSDLSISVDMDPALRAEDIMGIMVKKERTKRRKKIALEEDDPVDLVVVV